MAIMLYLLWEQFIGGIRTDHFILIGLFVGMYYSSGMTRKLFLGFSMFVIYWIVYDSMRIIPNYEVATVHIKEPYYLEKYLFGIKTGASLLTPNEYFNIHNNSYFDFLSGLFYINWVPIPLGFAIYLYFTDKKMFAKFSLSFVLLNFMGFMLYYVYPAAPPWYVEQYGFDLQLGVPGSRAGLIRFDELIGYPVFESIYNKNANVLAAIPSVHSINPMVVLFYGMKKKMGAVNIFFVIFMFGIWGSAVYTSQHYIIDVIAGIIVGIVGLWLVNRLFNTSYIDKLINRFVGYI